MKRFSTVPLIQVVDDFYDDPDKVRAEALSLDFQRTESIVLKRKVVRTDPGNLTGLSKKIITTLVGDGLERKIVESYFVSMTKRDGRTSKGRVHTDRYRQVGMLYLNRPQQCRGGTSFYRHKATGIVRREQIEGLSLKWIKRLFDDGRDLNQWEEVIRINMVYNRLLVFDSRMFHQASSFFGSSLKNSRLLQIFLPDIVLDSTLLEKKLERALH